MFCVECGKEKIIFKNGVCTNCFIKTHNFTKIPEIIHITVCTHCGAYKYKNTWLYNSFKNIFTKHLKNLYIIKNEFKKPTIEIKYKDKNDQRNLEVIISGFVDNQKISEKHFINTKIKKTVCNICSKRMGGYHEAIVQIRLDKRKYKETELIDIISFVENFVSNIQEKGHHSIFIADIGKEHGGLDFYISDKNAALNIAKKIQELYGGVIKTSSKNIGMKDGKQIYRMTYLIRLPSFRKGDYIFYKNKILKVISISKNKVHTLELSEWKEIIFDLKLLLNIKILGGKELSKEMILVSQTKNDIQIMDPDTYKTYEIKKPKQISYKSKKIKIVKVEDELFIIPINIKNDI